MKWEGTVPPISLVEHDVQAFQVYYWWAVWAAFDGNVNGARLWLKTMKEEAKEDPKLLELLTADQRKILVRITKLLQSGEHPRYLKKTDISPVFHELDAPSPFQSEKELSDFLFFNPKVLATSLAMPTLKLQLREFECLHGKMDIIGHSGDLTVIVELKIGEADHSVVTQLEKYMHTEYKRLHYGDRSDVLGVVIATSYSSFAEQELKKLNVIPIRYIMGSGILSLSPVVHLYSREISSC